MTPIDLSGLNYFLPLFGFLFVFLIVYALLIKTKILGDNKFVNVFIGLIIAVIFATMTSVQDYVRTVTPWFAVLVIALFFILIIIGLSQHKVDVIMKPGFVWVFIIALILVFLISAASVFSSLSSVWFKISDFVSNQARIAGAIILIVVAAVVAWVLTKK